MASSCINGSDDVPLPMSTRIEGDAVVFDEMAYDTAFISYTAWQHRSITDTPSLQLTTPVTHSDSNYANICYC